MIITMQEVSNFPIKVLCGAFILIMVGSSYYRKRLKKKILPLEFSESGQEEFQIDCTAELLSGRTKVSLWAYKSLILAPALYLLFLYKMTQENVSVDLFDLIHPSGNLFEFNLIFIAILGLSFGFVYFLRRFVYVHVRRALDLATNQKLIFEITSKHIRIPVLMLGDQALWKATKKSLFEVVIPFEEITKLEVYPLRGKENIHYKIFTKGESAFLCQGILGIKTGFEIFRLPLKRHENVIFSILHNRLQERFVANEN